MMQSQGTIPATGSEHPQINPEEFAMLESRVVEARYQAFTQEVDKMRERGGINQATQEHCKSVKNWAREKLEHDDRQVKGLKSFALSVEEYIERHSSREQASALELFRGQDRERATSERRTMSADQAFAASSSSTGHLNYTHIPMKNGLPYLSKDLF